MKKILGVLLIAFAIAVPFAATVWAEGFKMAVIGWGTAIVICLMLIIGLNLLE